MHGVRCGAHTVLFNPDNNPTGNTPQTVTQTSETPPPHSKDHTTSEQRLEASSPPQRLERAPDVGRRFMNVTRVHVQPGNYFGFISCILCLCS